jgi:hypothetical protein
MACAPAFSASRAESSGQAMATTINHRGVRIVTLEAGEQILDYCGSDDIAIVKDEDGWWTYFVGADGEVDGYDAPFESLNKALGTAKAAAEFMTSTE